MKPIETQQLVEARTHYLFLKIMKKQAKPTDRERELIFIIDNLMWQSARYAHGRRTMAPSIIRECVEKMKAMYPDWKVKKDHMIEPRQPGDSGFDSDYLNDIFNPTQK